MPDQFLLIKIEGMHCHRCQHAIQRVLQSVDGVYEAEVDFPSRLASVLYDPTKVGIRQLIDTVAEAGYHANGFMQHEAPEVSQG